jgi:hypothetical protein
MLSVPEIVRGAPIWTKFGLPYVGMVTPLAVRVENAWFRPPVNPPT